MFTFNIFFQISKCLLYQKQATDAEKMFIFKLIFYFLDLVSDMKKKQIKLQYFSKNKLHFSFGIFFSSIASCTPENTVMNIVLNSQSSGFPPFAVSVRTVETFDRIIT